MKYAVLIHEEESIWANLDAAGRQVYTDQHARFAKLTAELDVTVIAGEALCGVDTATTLRRRGTDITITAGPFAETAEQLCGLYLVDSPNLDAIIEAARFLPERTIEIRPVANLDEQAIGDAARHWGRLVALLIGQFQRIDLAEDAVQEAYAAAARTWPASGVPSNPAGWLLTAARRRALDTLRAEAIAVRKLPLLAIDDHTAPPARSPSGDDIADDRLRLIFMCCHPAVPSGSSAALTLRLVTGLKVSEIARLFLVSEATMAARITRAKRKIVDAGIPFAVPPPTRLVERLDVVLAVIYLVFTEGYVATGGAALVRTDLCDEAIRLGRTLDGLVDGQPAIAALRALMVLQHSRRSSRVDADGRPVLLGDQDRRNWHHGEIAEGLRLLTVAIRQRSVDPAAEQLAARYRLEALIAAAHATSPSPSATDWRAIASLYAELEELTGSPVVRINRAVAVAEADGPEVALPLLDGLDEGVGRGKGLALVRGELLARLGRHDEAITALGEAIDLATNDAEREYLERRRVAISATGRGSS